MTVTFGDDGGFAIFSNNKALHTGGQVTVQKKKLQTRRRNIRDKKNFSIFLDLLSYTDDPWWIGFLEQASQGKLPKHYTATPNNILYKCVKKSRIFDIDPTNKAELFSSLKQFMWETSSYESDQDTRLRLLNVKIEEPIILNYENTWTKIKASSKKLQIELLSYLEPMKKTYNLTIDDVRILVSNIKNMIMTNIFDKKSFQAENGSLISISGLFFDPETRTLKFTPSARPKEVSFDQDVEVDLNTDTCDFENVDDNNQQIHFMEDWFKFSKNYLY